jgi:hypothetical protein
MADKRTRTAKGNNSSQPQTWYSPSPIPGKAIACDWNPADQCYNINCREVDRKSLHPNLGSALQRVENAVLNYK